jgi:hypothetical protein
MSIYGDHFQVGDVIEIANADRPEWVNGRWRVTEVCAEGVELVAIHADGTADAARPSARIQFSGGRYGVVAHV